MHRGKSENAYVLAAAVAAADASFVETLTTEAEEEEEEEEEAEPAPLSAKEGPRVGHPSTEPVAEAAAASST